MDIEGGTEGVAVTDEGFHELANAIIMQAIKDFKVAYMILKKRPDHKEATAMVKEITHFFCGEYFTLLSDVNGPALLRKIKNRIDEKR